MPSRPSHMKRPVAPTGTQNISGASQQRDCPGVPPDSLLICGRIVLPQNQIGRKGNTFSFYSPKILLIIFNCMHTCMPLCRFCNGKTRTKATEKRTPAAAAKRAAPSGVRFSSNRLSCSQWPTLQIRRAGRDKRPRPRGPLSCRPRPGGRRHRSRRTTCSWCRAP